MWYILNAHTFLESGGTHHDQATCNGDSADSFCRLFVRLYSHCVDFFWWEIRFFLKKNNEVELLCVIVVLYPGKTDLLDNLPPIVIKKIRFLYVPLEKQRSSIIIRLTTATIKGRLESIMQWIHTSVGECLSQWWELPALPPTNHLVAKTTKNYSAVFC